MQYFTINRISGVILILIASAVGLYAGTFPVLDGGHPGPALFPRLIALLMALAGGGLIFSKSVKRENETHAYEFSGDHFRLLGFLAGTALIPLLYEFAGMLPGIGGIVLLAAFLFRVRWWVGVLAAAGTTLIIYGIFGRLLGVPL
ncbi:MAG: tripartite tricarboxylate transporter TctB family protein [Bacteroidia bacterium]|nr:tripartite tricarboxylate transporter TctB family protein [Bacteroidia bacterium]